MLRIVNLEFQQVSFFMLFLLFFSMILGQCFDVLRASRSHIQQSQLQPDDRYTDDDHFIKHLDGSDGRQENKPEPETKVDFFVDDILGQNAEMIFYFWSATRSNFRVIA